MVYIYDTLLYDIPQYEAIYTITNTSDSYTYWINLLLYKIWTKPNSLLLIKANSVLHKVSKLNYGNRSIFKIIYTQSDNINNNFTKELLRFKT